MKVWIESDACKSRAHCIACREDQGFRDSLRQHFLVPEDFDTKCPFAREGKYPSTREVAQNAIAAVRRAAVSVLQGKSPLANKAQAKMRLSVCKTCEQYDPEKGRCFVCGCFVNAKTKVTVESCPEGKW